MIPSATRADVLAHVTAVLDELSAAQLEELATGRARLVFRSEAGARSSRLVAPRRSDTDVSAAVETINQLTGPAEVAGYLHRQRFTVPVLREIARALGPTVYGCRPQQGRADPRHRRRHSGFPHPFRGDVRRGVGLRDISR